MHNNFDIKILNLIQHIELNKAGWWDDVIQRLILATIWMDGKYDSLPVDTLNESIFSHFELRLDAKLNSAINLLIVSGDLIQLPDGSIKLSEARVKLLDSEIHDAEATIIKAKTVFIDTLESSGFTSDEKDQLWINFNDVFLKPFIKSIGANIYDFLNGKSTIIDQFLLEAYLNIYPHEQRSILNNSAQLFLSSKNPDVRSYILRFLNVYFCIEASGLDKSTLESLQGSLAKPQEIILFIDTNFLFSILELHENPSNVAAVGVIELIKNLKGNVNVKLYVSNQTLQEARIVLRRTIDNLNGARITPNIADAASKFVSGLSKKYLSEVNRSKISLTPQDFFQPYVDNLVSLLRKKGVEISSEDTAALNIRQDVVDDILRQSDYEEQKWGERAKGYKPLEHDIVLWHFIKDKRKISIDSPLDAKYWIVTIDFRFLGFDDYQKSLDIVTVPICIHPTTLIQLLQFWIPRSQLLEDTLYSSLWLPFVFRDLDPQAENITIEIVKTLGRFEQVGDLPKDTVVGILLNDALRQKIKNEADVERQVELVKEALIEENLRATEAAEAARIKNLEYEQELQRKEAGLNQVSSNLQETRGELDKEKAGRQKLEEEIVAIRTEINNKEKANEVRFAKLKFSFWGLALPIIILIVIWLFSLMLFFEGIKIALAITGVILFVWALVFNCLGSRNDAIAEIPMFKKFHSAIKWFKYILGVIMLGLITNALYDLICNIFKTK